MDLIIVKIYNSPMSKPVRLWATTDPVTYQKLLIHIASSVDETGKKIKIGEFVEQAVKEKLERQASSHK